MKNLKSLSEWVLKNSFLILLFLIIAGGAVFFFWPESRSQEDLMVELEQKANYAFTVGNYNQARAMCEELLSTMEKVHGKTDPRVALALNNLALVLRAQGKSDEALPLLERALAINESAPGRDPRQIVKALINLGLLHEDLGQRDDAKRFHQKAIYLANISLPEEDPLLLYTKQNLNRLDTAQTSEEE